MIYLLILTAIICLFISLWLIYFAMPARIKYEFNYSHTDNCWRDQEITLWVRLNKFFNRVPLISNYPIMFLLIVYILLFVLIYFQIADVYIGKLPLILIAIAILGGFGTSLLVGINKNIDPCVSTLSYVFKEINKAKEFLVNALTSNKAETVFYSGYIDLPKKFTVNESADIIIYLGEESFPFQNGREHMEIIDSSADSIKLLNIQAHTEPNVDQFIKTELLAASLKVAGDSKQQLNLANKYLKFQWNISSDQPTHHKFNLIFSKISGSEIKILSEIQHTVKVINLWGLTKRQAYFASGVFATLTAALGYYVKSLFI